MMNIDINENSNVGYQFVAEPMNLMACCDNNCRSMLWTLVQLSSYYANEDGWFFRTNEDLRAQTRLSENVVRATLSTFYSIGIIDVETVGTGKSKTPNRFRLNIDKFTDWERHSLEDCIKHPGLMIRTDNYKATGWQPSYLQKLGVESKHDPLETPLPSTTPLQSEHNIDNIENVDNKNNILSEGSKQVEVKNPQFDEYKKREDVLMDKLYHATTWTDFKTFLKQIYDLISTAASEKVADKTRKRYNSIVAGKIKFLKNKISKEPYNSFYDDFYREYDCGWLGKERTGDNLNEVRQEMDEEEQMKAQGREIFTMWGMEIPEELKPKQKIREYEEFRPFDEESEEDLPF